MSDKTELLPASTVPVAWMLADAVGGSVLEFQRDLLAGGEA